MRVEMAGRRRQIRRLHRIAAGELDDVEGLHQLQQVAVVVEVAGAPPAIEIGDVRRRGDRAEIDVVVAEGQVVLRIARMERELPGRLGDMLQHEFARQADAGAISLNLGPCCFRISSRFVIQELDAEFFQDAQEALWIASS